MWKAPKEEPQHAVVVHSRYCWCLSSPLSGDDVVADDIANIEDNLTQGKLILRYKVAQNHEYTPGSFLYYDSVCAFVTFEVLTWVNYS